MSLHLGLTDTSFLAYYKKLSGAHHFPRKRGCQKILVPVKPFADHCRRMARTCAWEIGEAVSIPFSRVGITPMACPVPEGAIATMLVCAEPGIVEV